MKNIYVFIDDSGVLKKNHLQKYFIYAGLVFLSESELSAAYSRYSMAKETMQLKLNLDHNSEIKGINLNTEKDSKFMFSTYERVESFALAVENDNLPDYVDFDSKSRQRFKDYLLRTVIKLKIESMIADGSIKSDEDIRIIIRVDEQNSSMNGIYSLAEGIKDEFSFGISNFNYGSIHNPVFKSVVEVTSKFLTSENNLMIQAADNLANRVWESYFHDDEKLRKKRRHLNIKLF
jgi:hypothetical protein